MEPKRSRGLEIESARRRANPELRPGRSGLRQASFALVDRVRSVDKRRVVGAFGRLPAEELAAIDEGLLLFLGLG